MPNRIKKKKGHYKKFTMETMMDKIHHIMRGKEVIIPYYVMPEDY